MAARSCGVRVVSTLANDAYGPDHESNTSYNRSVVHAAQAVDALSAQLATRFHAISQTVADTMSKRLHVAPKKIDVVWRGRDADRLGTPSGERKKRARESLMVGDAPVVLHPARIDKQKGVDITVRAFATVRAAVPGSVLLLAGRYGNAADEVRQIADDIGSEGIRFLGERGDVPDLMCAADVISFPTRWEGLGGALIEAMALEVPFVATDIPAVREVTGGVAFALVPTERPDVLAEHLIDVLRSPEAAACSVQRGRERYLGNFTIAQSATRMREFYDRSLGAMA
jgi:glycosyltransferase involved in cell wall biosynthesis